MRLLLPVALLATSAFFFACQSSNDATSEGDLIGGRVAAEGELAATIQIQGGCTAAKVGPRHILTAAHCLGRHFVGQPINVTNAKAVGTFAPDGQSEVFAPYVIERIEVEPHWLESCGPQGTGCGGVHVSGRGNFADAAVIIVSQDIAGIPEAAIDLSPVRDGDGVIITGYGCEDAVGGFWSYQGSRLRIANTQAVAFDETVHNGSFIYASDKESGLLAQMAGIYGITPGPNYATRRPPPIPIVDDGGALADAGAIVDSGNAPEASDGGAPTTELGGLCPGDSGGPLYRSGGDGLTIVGINANYTFNTGSNYDLNGISFMYGGSPVTNWHTRTDATSGLKVGAWLASLGVKTTCSAGDCDAPPAPTDAGAVD